MRDWTFWKTKWQFFSEWFFIWGPLVSGTFSVPFYALAVFSEAKYGPLIWGTMAYGAMLVSSYLLWLRVANLEKQRIQKISSPTYYAKPPCRSVETFIDQHGSKTDAVCFRLEIKNIGEETVLDCEGHLIEVYFEGEFPELGPLNLTWALGAPYSIKKDIIKGVSAYLDVININQNNNLRACCGGWPNNQQSFFKRHGNYIFKIVLSARNSTPLSPYSFRVDFTGDWQTSTMEPY